MNRSYDLAVIGGGSAGYNAARVAAGLGMRVAVVDGARELGGLCILRGCMPSKTLIYSAEVLHLARSAGSFGLGVRGAVADMAAVQARKKSIIGDFAAHRVRQLESGGFSLIRTHARFRDAGTLELGRGGLIRARNVLLATGSKVSVPPLPGLAATPFWTSDDVLNLEFRPRSVIVLGGGIVACELAQFLHRMGTRVCLIQRSADLLRNYSKEAAAVVKQALMDEGMEVHAGTEIQQIRSIGKGVSVRFRQGDRVFTRRADHLFNALGREPNTSLLGLDRAGVKTAPNGRILANKWQQTSAPHVYAAGDCCGPHEIVHVAIQQGELAARHMAGMKGLMPVDDSMLLGVVFTDPQIGAIGRSEQYLLQNGVRYLAASHPFNDHGKSILMNANYGYVKVLADSQGGRILGAEIVGKDAGELIHCFSAPLAMRATVFDMLRAPWYHPTLAEIVTYPLEEIADRLTRRRPDRSR